MPTEAQRKANRQNAKKSTGPRTPEGKARSSKNALKHGLLARDAVMADEDPAEYDRQLQILEENLFPKNAIEFELVLQIADSRWRLRRITRIEAGLTTYQYHGTDRLTRERYPDTVVPGRNGENQLLGKSMQDHTQALHNLARYRTMTSRDITRALRMIRQLRKDEYECKENRAANGAIHRRTLTDPDHYTTPTRWNRNRRATSPRPRQRRRPTRSASAPRPLPRKTTAILKVGARHAVPGSPAPRKTSRYRPDSTTTFPRHESPITKHESPITKAHIKPDLAETTWNQWA